MYDVLVVGGGPGGLYGARQLSAKGFKVVLVEEHSSIGRPVHCTGVLGNDAYGEFDLPRTAILNQLNTVRFFSPSGQTFSYTPDRPDAVVIDRAMFDDALGHQVLDAGATMISGTKVSAIDIDQDGVTAALSDGLTLHARVCILACGANYTLHRSIGLGSPSVFLVSAQAEVPSSKDGDIEVHFPSQVAPGGFAWVVPIKRGESRFARVGLICASQVDERFREFASSIETRWGIPPASAINPMRKMLPLAPIAKTFGDRFVVVGDAAGLVKSTTGGGIFYSIVSAGIAADVLSTCLKSNQLGADSLYEYERRWRSRLGAELETQLMFRHRAQSLATSDIEDLFELARTDSLLPLVRKTASFNQHRKLILALLRHREFRNVLLRRYI